MKTRLTRLAACLLAVMTTADADLLRIEAGGGLWMQSSDGTVTYDDGAGSTGEYRSDKKNTDQAYLWLFIKHPVPILPNLRLEYTAVSDKGTAKGSFNDFTTPSGPAKIDIVQYDIVPYYNLLDNTFWLTLDLGLDIKVLRSDLSVDNVRIDGTGPLTRYTDSRTLALPMLYARVRAQVPATGFGFEADGKYVTYDGSTLYDFRIKADYTFDVSPVVQPGVEVGYRLQKFDLSADDGDTETDLDFTGFYAGVMLRF